MIFTLLVYWKVCYGLPGSQFMDLILLIGDPVSFPSLAAMRFTFVTLGWIAMKFSTNSYVLHLIILLINFSLTP